MIEKTILCNKCRKRAVTLIRYAGIHLCKMHFNQFVEQRIKKEIRRQGRIMPGSLITIALSGGKDSILTLYMLHNIFSKSQKIRLEALLVDEGIRNYREHALKYAQRACAELNINLSVIKFKAELGYELDTIVTRCKLTQTRVSPCTYCGVFRRYLLNVKSRELGATKVAFGLNLDDYAQSIMMNVFKADMAKLARLGPHSNYQPGLIPRLMPLRMIPEKEVYLYLHLNGIDAYTGECPYAGGAQRNFYRAILYQLETKAPGTRHAVVSSYDLIADVLLNKFPPQKLHTCLRCNEPTSSEKRICKRCVLLEQIDLSFKAKTY